MNKETFATRIALICGKPGVKHQCGKWLVCGGRELPTQLLFDDVGREVQEFVAEIYNEPKDLYLVVTYDLRRECYTLQENKDNGEIEYHCDRIEAFREVCKVLRKLLK